MTPTRLGSLLGAGLAATVVAYLVVRTSYGSLPPLPGYAPVTLVLLAIFLGGLARTVRERIAGRRSRRGRALHPLQIARAAALAKASSLAGAVLTGLYGGFLAHVLPLQAEQARDDAVIAASSCAAALALTGAALLLERACRTPDVPPSVEP